MSPGPAVQETNVLFVPVSDEGGTGLTQTRDDFIEPQKMISINYVKQIICLRNNQCKNIV